MNGADSLAALTFSNFSFISNYFSNQQQTHTDIRFYLNLNISFLVIFQKSISSFTLTREKF